MKPTITKLKIVLVYELAHEHQNNMFTGKASTVAVPKGQVHIFEMEEDEEGGLAPSRLALCGRTRSDIGEQTIDSDRRPEHMPMCTTCEKNWKEHPDSPWLKWKEGKAI